MSNYLLAVENRQPRLVETFEDGDRAVQEQIRLEDERIQSGVPTSERYFIVRPPDDVLGLVEQALAAKSATVEHGPRHGKHPTRRIEGVTMVSQGNRFWQSTDGMFEILWEDGFLTECDEPHPVKISKAMRERYLAEPSYRQRLYPWNMRTAIAEGKRGYYCEGNEEHVYGLWILAANDQRSVIARGETFDEMLGALGEHLRTGRIFA